MDQRQSFNNIKNILLIEDNPGDVYLIKECFSMIKTSVNVFVAKDGGRASEILFPVSNNNIIFDLVLIDLNVPVKNGKELLFSIRNHPSTKHLPAAILSSSNNEEDIQYCKNLGILDYFIKPYTLEELQNIVISIEKLLLRN